MQRGICRWYLSLHSDGHPIVVSLEKKKTPAKPKSAKKGKKVAITEVNEDAEDADGGDDNIGANSSAGPAGAATNIPPPFMPAVTKILKMKPLSRSPPGLPEGLSVATLKSRLSGKKVK